jgi:SAM-dependent methyltransferase
LRAEAWGIDFSRAGLAMASRAVTPGGAPVRLVEGDVFDRSKLPGGAFHVVFSGGFVEHFPSPQPVMERFCELLAPTGVVVTSVPNLCGVNGWLQRHVDMDIWRRHVVLSLEALDAAHATAGLVPLAPARYLGTADPGSVNFGRFVERMPPPARRAFLFAMAKIRRAGIWWGERSSPNAGRWWAPALAGVYRRRDDPAFV